MLLRPFINHLPDHISINIDYLSLLDIFWTIQHLTLTSSQWKNTEILSYIGRGFQQKDIESNHNQSFNVIVQVSSQQQPTITTDRINSSIDG